MKMEIRFLTCSLCSSLNFNHTVPWSNTIFPSLHKYSGMDKVVFTGTCKEISESLHVLNTNILADCNVYFDKLHLSDFKFSGFPQDALEFLKHTPEDYCQEITVKLEKSDINFQQTTFGTLQELRNIIGALDSLQKYKFTVSSEYHIVLGIQQIKTALNTWSPSDQLKLKLTDVHVPAFTAINLTEATKESALVSNTQSSKRPRLEMEPSIELKVKRYYSSRFHGKVFGEAADASKLAESTKKFKEYYGVSLRLPEEDRYLGFETLKQRTEDFVRHLSQKDISLYEDI